MLWQTHSGAGREISKFVMFADAVLSVFMFIRISSVWKYQEIYKEQFRNNLRLKSQKNSPALAESYWFLQKMCVYAVVMKRFGLQLNYILVKMVSATRNSQ